MCFSILKRVCNKNKRTLIVLKSSDKCTCNCHLGPDRLESIILKIIGKKIDNPPCHLQSIIPENSRRFANYSSK